MSYKVRDLEKIGLYEACEHSTATHYRINGRVVDLMEGWREGDFIGGGGTSPGIKIDYRLWRSAMNINGGVMLSRPHDHSLWVHYIRESPHGDTIETQRIIVDAFRYFGILPLRVHKESTED